MSPEQFVANVNSEIINPLLALLFAGALGFFLWGMVEFILNAEGEQGREVGRRHMLWGIIGMAIMVGVFGIITILIQTFGINLPAGVSNQFGS